MSGIAIPAFVIGRSLVPVGVVTLSRFMMAMIMGMTSIHLVGMPDNHKTMRSQHGYVRDDDH